MKRYYVALVAALVLAISLAFGNEFYAPSGNPSTGAAASSAVMRAEFNLIKSGFDLLPTMAGHGDETVVINSGGTALTSTSSATFVKLQTFTGSGTYTPNAGMKYIIVHMVGGGGGGATLAAGNYGGGGGGAGEYATGVFTAANIGVSQTVTIGAAGAANGSGGTTSLGALLTAVGGTGGASAVGQAGGTGGTGTGLHSPGGYGVSGDFANAVPQAIGGNGGASYFGGGGRGGLGGTDAGQAGGAYGSGGGGGGFSATWSAGGAGATGAMVIYEYK